MWCYFARDVRRRDGAEPERGISVVDLPEGETLRAVADGRVDHALNLAALLLALTTGRISLP